MDMDPSPTDTAPQTGEEKAQREKLLLLSLGALGVVYGDIGTSPLYALRLCFHGEFSLPATQVNVLGALSLIFWALVVMVSLKYISLVMQADNQGDGGIIALVALLSRRPETQRKRWFLIAMGLFGAALLYGDGLITPAISVLSAVEGLETASHSLARFVVPLACAILLLLFAFQRRGTGKVGAAFGPFMLLWFIVLSIFGAVEIVRAPRVMGAINPLDAIAFFRANGKVAFGVLGAVFLAVTGGEALYADMGHFGSRPIRLAWFGLVLPALVLNYFGQGALLLNMPQAASDSFYALIPRWALYPMIALATVATVIASQAIISGAFSLTRQAMNLGEWPRMRVVQTSSEEIGQVYLPGINSTFLIGTLALVVGFGSSDALAGAYGVGVASTMVITTLLVARVTIDRWQWHPALTALVCVPLLALDSTFFSANMLKIPHGGWFPLVVGLLGFALMSTWKRGREVLTEHLQETVEPMDKFLARITDKPPIRIPGTAIFVTGRPIGTPPMLLHQLQHNRVLQETVALVTVLTEDVPRIPSAERLQVRELSEGFVRIMIRYGFTQPANVPAALRLAHLQGIDLDLDHATYYIGRETIIPGTRFRTMAPWRKKLFTFIARNAASATAFFRIPPEQVFEIGMELEI